MIRLEELDPSVIDHIIERLGRIALLNVVDGSFLQSVPQVLTAAAYTVLERDSSLIANRAGTITLTFPAASIFPGRALLVRTIQNQAVVSASADVVPLAGGAAGTAILAATAGRWALLLSDGAVWQIMMGN